MFNNTIWNLIFSYLALAGNYVINVIDMIVKFIVIRSIDFVEL